MPWLLLSRQRDLHVPALKVGQCTSYASFCLYLLKTKVWIVKASHFDGFVIIVDYLQFYIFLRTVRPINVLPNRGAYILSPPP